jgi:hypothetical protein
MNGINPTAVARVIAWNITGLLLDELVTSLPGSISRKHARRAVSRRRPGKHALRLGSDARLRRIRLDGDSSTCSLKAIKKPAVRLLVQPPCGARGLGGARVLVLSDVQSSLIILQFL